MNFHDLSSTFIDFQTFSRITFGFAAVVLLLLKPVTSASCFFSRCGWLSACTFENEAALEVLGDLVRAALLETLFLNVVGFVSSSPLDAVDLFAIAVVGAEDSLDLQAAVNAIFQLLFLVDEEHGLLLLLVESV